MTNESGDDLKALCGQLRAVESSSTGGGPLDIGSVTTNWHRNPNGPQAADTIERLQADLERAVEVMKPFAEAAVAVEEAGQIVSQSPDETSIEAALWESQQPTVDHLRAARSFIASRRGG
jgi:hypothetical protein